MKEIIRPPKQLNLPRDIYDELHNFVPYPSHDDAVITKRRSAPGTLIPDMELRGIRVLQQLDPSRFDSPRDQRAARDILARAGIGSAYHGLRNEDVMYSPLRLGLVADGTRTRSTEQRYTSRDELHAKTQHWLSLAEHTAQGRYTSLHAEGRSEFAHTLERNTGRYIGNAALSTLVYDMAEHVSHLHPVDAQLAVREQSLAHLRNVREYSQSIGALPSVAQLVEPDSPVAVDTRRHAPSAVRRAYEDVLAQYPEQIAS